MIAITRDYYCTACLRVHRIASLVGQAHKTFNEWEQRLRASTEPVAARGGTPRPRQAVSAGSVDVRERVTRTAGE